MRASDFIPGLLVHQAFCFTNPTFEAVDSLLSEVVATPKEQMADFRQQVVCTLAMPKEEMGRAWKY